MWSYYGAKTNIVHLYPPPKYGKIIEPFAGSARYALRYFDREILLVDKYDVVIKVWKWLQQCSPKDILRYERKWKVGDRLENIQIDCEEAKMLLGFLITTAEKPRKQVTSWIGDPTRDRINFSLRRISNNLFKIKHWTIVEGCYTELANEKATWFIDPPYEIGGHAYVHNNKKIDFMKLGYWCKNRMGQVIVCESGNANWLPFIPFVGHKTRTGWQREVFWTNEPTSYGVKQSSFIDQLI